MIAQIQLYLIIAGVTLALGVITNGITAYKFYGYGKAHEIAICQAEKDKATDKKLTIREKQNEIRNHEPDNAVTIKRLLTHSF